MRLTPLIILFSFLVLIPVISFAKCINLEKFKEANLIQVTDKILLDESRQIIFRKDKVALSIVRFNKPSNNQEQLKKLTKSVATQLSKITDKTSVKTINLSKNQNASSRLYQLIFTTKNTIPTSLEVAGIFSDPLCTEVVRFSEMNPVSIKESLSRAVSLIALDQN
jgi:hypothetical protein